MLKISLSIDRFGSKKTQIVLFILNLFILLECQCLGENEVYKFRTEFNAGMELTKSLSIS